MFTDRIPIPGYTWRAPRYDDLPALYDMLLAVDRAETRALDLSLEDMYTQFNDPWCNPETDFRLAFTASGQVAAMARVFLNPHFNAEERRVYLWDEIHPEHRGRGLEEFVLDWMERVQDTPSHVPRTLRITCQDDLHGYIALIERRGFRPVRYSYRMRRDLKQPVPAPTLPVGLTMRRYSPELARPMLDTFNQAFQDHWSFEPVTFEEWQMFFIQSHSFRPDLTFVVMDGDQVIGLSLNMVNTETNQRYGIREGWVSELGVLRAWRKRGVAAALLCRAMQAFKDDGPEYAALGVDSENPTGALRLYEKLGFGVSKRFITFARPVE